MRKKKDDFKGPKSLEAWIEVYERRAGDDVHFQLEDGEHVYYHPEYGFFTWYLCVNHPARVSIPKMCGDGKFLRRLVCEFIRRAPDIKELMFCSRRTPEVYCNRVLRGCRLDHTEQTVNLNTGRSEPLYFFVVTLDVYKGSDDVDD